MKPRYRNIVICGDIGTGTSTLAKGLAQKLGWRYFSAGDIFRKYHREHNIPLWNKMAIPENFERQIDKEIIELVKNEDKTVVDSHYTGWFFRDSPGVFKILLVTDKKEATKRILERNHTHKETSEEVEKRRWELRKKFKKLYSNDNYEDPKYFHLIIDTTKTNIEETINKAYKEFKKS